MRRTELHVLELAPGLRRDNGDGGGILGTLDLSERATAEAVIPADAPRIPMLSATGLADTPEETMHTGFVTRMHRFHLGPHAIDQPTVSSNPRAGGGVNLFGAYVLGRFHVVLDYERDRLILEPNARFGTPQRTDASGMLLICDEEDASIRRVAFVVPGGPADRAGIRRGDELLEIDGEPATSRGLHATRELFLKSGTYELLMRRGSETTKAILDAQELI